MTTETDALEEAIRHADSLEALIAARPAFSLSKDEQEILALARELRHYSTLKAENERLQEIVDSNGAFADEAMNWKKELDAITALLDAGTHKIVPVEPTREMWAASGDDQHKRYGGFNYHHDVISECVWSAMMRAAPSVDLGDGG